MKFTLFWLVIFTVSLNFSCQQKVESSPIAANETIAVSPEPSPTPIKYEEIDLQEQFSTRFRENPTAFAEYQDYKIERVTVKEREDVGIPEIDIFDAVLLKNGKFITRFKGDFNPLGNDMSFTFFPFLGNSEKQLLVFDESGRQYERDWIVSVSSKYEVIFDSKDYNIWWGRISVVDLDKDGVFELIEYYDPQGDLLLANMYTPWMEVVFKYDSKTRKYLPANHQFTEYILENVEEDVKNFKWDDDRDITKLVEIMFKYIYTGKEEEAWQFYDEKMDSVAPENLASNFPGKRKFKERLISGFRKDPVYKFIKAKLKNRN